MPTDQQECLHDEYYMRDVQVLIASYGVLVIVCGATLLTRSLAACHHGLPLLAIHVFFLLLVLGALALRMVDLVVLPCFFTMECGMTMVNFCANAPIMMMFTIFTMLLYHTFIVVHSIHLSYEPIFAQSGSGCLRNPSLHAGGVPPRPRSSSGGTHWDAAQTGAPSQLHARNTSRRRRCCDVHCRFWVLLWGRPHSAVKVAVILLNTVMWLLFILVLILDSRTMLAIEFRRGRRPTHFEFDVYLLELPSLVFASLISLCFSISGAKLFKRLFELRKVLELEASEASAPSDGDNHLQSSSLKSPLRDTHEEVMVMSSVASDGRLPQEHGGPGGGHHGHSDVLFVTSTVPASTSNRGYSMSSSAITPANIGSRISIASMRYRSSRVSLSSVTASFLNFDEPILSLTGIKLLICGVRRMLVVVGVCVAAFLFRALFLMYITLRAQTVFPRRMWLPYLFISEVAPYAVLLTFYLIPGLQAICARKGNVARREDVSASVNTTGEA